MEGKRKERIMPSLVATSSDNARTTFVRTHSAQNNNLYPLMVTIYHLQWREYNDRDDMNRNIYWLLRLRSRIIINFDVIKIGFAIMFSSV